MKKTMLLLAAMAAFLALSCQKEMEVTESVDDNAFALKASIEDLSTPTKATINGSHQFLWSASDKIGVYVSDWGTKNQPFTLSGAGGERTGSFVYDYDGGAFSATTATAAYFPWNGTNIETDNNVSGSTMYFKLKQGYDNYLSGQMLTPLVSPMTYSAGSYAPITFKHAGAAVKVVVSNVPAGAHSMGLVAEGQQIRGGYHTDFK